MTKDPSGFTAETALSLARYFHTNAEFWLNLQNFYDLEVSRRSGKVSERSSAKYILHHRWPPDCCLSRKVQYCKASEGCLHKFLI